MEEAIIIINTMRTDDELHRKEHTLECLGEVALDVSLVRRDSKLNVVAKGERDLDGHAMVPRVSSSG